MAGIATTSWPRAASASSSPRECQDPEAPSTPTRSRSLNAANERSSTSGASPPPWWARPDSVLVSVTAAGLNSIGSMS